jgi:hypothetical protein
MLESTLSASKIPMPQNKGNDADLTLRELDCAAIQSLHSSIADDNEREFDSVRGVFWEGKRLYPNAGFREKIIFKSVSEILNVLKAISFLLNA